MGTQSTPLEPAYDQEPALVLSKVSKPVRKARKHPAAAVEPETALSKSSPSELGRIAGRASGAARRERATGRNLRPTDTDDQQYVMPAAHVVDGMSFLPRWPDPVRGMPNAILKSAIFGICQDTDVRKTVEWQLTASYGKNLEVWYLGPMLNQRERRLFEDLVHFARDLPLGTPLKFSGDEFLAAQGKGKGGRQHEMLRKRLRRLSQAWIEVKLNGERSFYGGLISTGAEDLTTRMHSIVINPALIHLYGPEAWSSLSADVCDQLNDQLALWLYGFYMTHENPFPVKVEQLWALSNSGSATLNRFRAELKKAIREIMAVCKGWQMEIGPHDMLYVSHPGTKAQKRHRAKRQQAEGEQQQLDL